MAGILNGDVFLSIKLLVRVVDIGCFEFLPCRLTQQSQRFCLSISAVIRERAIFFLSFWPVARLLELTHGRSPTSNLTALLRNNILWNTIEIRY